MSFRAVSNVIDYAPSNTTSSEMVILIILADYADDETWGCWPSIGKLVDKSRLSRSTVIRVLNKLAQKGQIKIERRKGESGVDQSSRYYLAEHYKRGGFQSDTLECQSDTLECQDDIELAGGEGVKLTPDPINIDHQKIDTNVSMEKFRELLDLWRKLFPKKPQPRISNNTLHRKFNIRIKSAYFAENYEQALQVATKSSFLRESGWFDLDWFLKNDNNWEKCLVGKYTDSFSGNGQHKQTSFQYDQTAKAGRL